jgi:GNAT superfamily N-acetyltransferase
MITVRAMKENEADAVAAMFRQLPADVGQDYQPRITGNELIANADLIHVLVANDSDILLGACSWLLTFSTWRASKGMYVCDLYVVANRRGEKLGERLLRAAAKDAAMLGASFIKLEVSIENPNPSQFYRRVGFHKSDDDAVWFLESENFPLFLEG